MNAQAKLTVEGPQHKIASLAHHLKKIAHRKSPLDQLAKLHLSLWILCHDLCPYLLCPFHRPFHVVLRPEPPKNNRKKKRVFFFPKVKSDIKPLNGDLCQSKQGSFRFERPEHVSGSCRSNKNALSGKRSWFNDMMVLFSDIFYATGIYATSHRWILRFEAMDAGQP